MKRIGAVGVDSYMRKWQSPFEQIADKSVIGLIGTNIQTNEKNGSIATDEFHMQTNENNFQTSKLMLTTTTTTTTTITFAWVLQG